MCVDGNLLRLKSLVLGASAFTTLLLGAPAAWAASVKDCQEFARVTRNQIDSATQGNVCPAATGPQWTNGKEHFQQCLITEPEEWDRELNKRRRFLLACSAERGRKPWSRWDTESCGARSICTFGFNPEGLQRCNDEGQLVMKALKVVQGNRSMLFDHVKDPNFYYSDYYLRFNHWTDFRCVEETASSGVRRYALQGYTGAGVQTAPNNGPIVAPGPVQGTKVGKGPVIAKDSYTTTRRTYPYTRY